MIEERWKDHVYELKTGKKICNCQLDGLKVILARKDKINKINEKT